MGYLDERLATEKKFKFTIKQLDELIRRLDTIIPEKSTLSPDYDVSTLILKIRKADMDFNNRWEGHLFGNDKWRKQHFTRIKALARRLGNSWGDEYDDLRPISDFWANFNSQLSSFLASPSSWNQANPDEQDQQRSIDNLKQKVSAKVFEYAKKSIKDEKIGDWQTAFDFSGRGSALERAKKIESIYNETVPIPEDEMTYPVKQFLSEIMKIIKETVVQNGGKITSIFNT